MDLSPFNNTVFTRPIRLTESPFIRPVVARTEILPHLKAIRLFIESGWVGQPKWLGFRAQIHIPHDKNLDIIIYNLRGRIHPRPLPEQLENDLRRFFRPTKGWNVFDCEWIKSENAIVVYDILKVSSELLTDISFLERWQKIPRVHGSKKVQAASLIRSASGCQRLLATDDSRISGITFRSTSTPGFASTTAIKCRKNQLL